MEGMEMASTIAIADHPSNLDKTARLVSEDRAGRWSVYAVKGGFVGIVDHRAIEGLFTNERDAHDTINLLIPAGPSSLSETFATTEA